VSQTHKTFDLRSVTVSYLKFYMSNFSSLVGAFSLYPKVFKKSA